MALVPNFFVSIVNFKYIFVFSVTYKYPSYIFLINAFHHFNIQEYFNICPTYSLLLISLYNLMFVV